MALYGLHLIASSNTIRDAVLFTLLTSDGRSKNIPPDRARQLYILAFQVPAFGRPHTRAMC